MQVLKQNNAKAIKKHVKQFLFLFTLAALAASLSIGIFAVDTADAAQVFSGEVSDVASRNYAAASKKSTSEDKYSGLKLYPGGMPFGVKFYTKGILVVGMSDVVCKGVTSNPAYDSGIRIKDIIIKVNGSEVNTVADVTDALERSQGKPLTFTVTRGSTQHDFTVTPLLSDNDSKYKAGVWIRDSTAGIGTVTYIYPDNAAFGGLGHGICDVDTGELMPLMRGSVMNVTISGIVKGKSGIPGEIKGYFNSEKIGSLNGNTESGVYGVFTDIPKTMTGPIPIAKRNEIKEGKAYIYSTLDNGGIEIYKIELSKIDNTGKENRSFIIKVTDEKLIEKTGGIVQGMSGSPIIQGGKLVGAVTHVMVNDPLMGYGIFIENMLDKMPDILK